MAAVLEQVRLVAASETTVLIRGETGTGKEGIARMAKWVKAYGSRESTVFGEVEILKNLPPSWASVIRKRNQT